MYLRVFVNLNSAVTYEQLIRCPTINLRIDNKRQLPAICSVCSLVAENLQLLKARLVSIDRAVSSIQQDFLWSLEHRKWSPFSKG